MMQLFHGSNVLGLNILEPHLADHDGNLGSPLLQVSGERGFTTGYKRCRRCGYETTEDFDFCPKCGTRF